MAYSKRVRYADPSKPLGNARWEAFAQGLAAGKTQGKAAVLAGFSATCAPSRGCELIRRPLIKARVEYLRTQSTNSAIATIALCKGDILDRLREIAVLGIKSGELSAANRALELIGKELGMFVERKVIGVQALIAEMTPENLRLASATDLLRLTNTLESVLLLSTGDQPEPAENQG